MARDLNAICCVAVRIAPYLYCLSSGIWVYTKYVWENLWSVFLYFRARFSSLVKCGMSLKLWNIYLISWRNSSEIAGHVTGFRWFVLLAGLIALPVHAK
jgi:hypothetical protein